MQNSTADEAAVDEDAYAHGINESCTCTSRRKPANLVVLLVAALQLGLFVAGGIWFNHTYQRFYGARAAGSLIERFPLVAPSAFEPALIEARFSDGETSRCSGMPLEDSDVVLTARHCLYGQDNQRLVGAKVTWRGMEYRVLKATHPVQDNADIAVLDVRPTSAESAARIGDTSIFTMSGIGDSLHPEGDLYTYGWQYPKSGWKFPGRCVNPVREISRNGQEIRVPCGLGHGASGGPFIQDTRILGVVSRIYGSFSNGITPVDALNVGSESLVRFDIG